MPAKTVSDLVAKASQAAASQKAQADAARAAAAQIAAQRGAPPAPPEPVSGQ